MKIYSYSIVLFTLFFLGIELGQASESKIVHHEMSMELVPDRAELVVEDTITLGSDNKKPAFLSFILHANLEVSVKGATLEKKPSLSAAFTKMAADAAVPLTQYDVTLDKKQDSFKLIYKGQIKHGVEQHSEEYARSFSETPGLISEQGVFLARSTKWYPVFKAKERVTFNIRISVPDSWGAVSQGKLDSDEKGNAKRTLTWIEENPQDDIYIVASRYYEYQQSIGNATAMVFMRKKDDALAQKYLDVTGQYISMYTSLLGPYPYAKFALVENFWETGYGMPSFTLLGPQVIRFPFIIHSSYPHEILHNYWGNGVYVDYESGNWAEGLTAYLADHLIQEQRGNGAGYRRNVLQKYTDFVNKEKDFPLTQFRSRHSSATEAVGYGKTMMIFHMLRTDLGERNFIRALRALYKNKRFDFATFDDVRDAFSKSANQDFEPFFQQWVKRAGAPKIRTDNVKVTRKGKAYLVNFTLHQDQGKPYYRLKIPVVIYLEGEEKVFQKTVELDSQQRVFALEVESRPLRIDIDPQFDVFRRLDSREIPSALSQGFGDDRPLVVLPTDDSVDRIKAYRQLANQWKQSQAGTIEITDDKQLKVLPADRAVWLLGARNAFRDVLFTKLKAQGTNVASDTINLNNKTVDVNKHAIVLTSRHPKSDAHTILWLNSPNTKAIAGLARKLPHYRKYSYLAFEGDAPENFVKGQWEVKRSPMRVSLHDNIQVSKNAKPIARQPLALLPPAFSAKDMMADIRYLAHDDRKGRELGTAELDDAAAYIARQFQLAGLESGGDKAGSYFQEWTEDLGKPKGKTTLKNVVGVLPGKNQSLAGESVVISAHYDHLGLGWPDVHKGDQGKIHNGADDNASGVAVMLELARRVAKKWKPERSILFIAFTGEEAMRLGSRYYVKNAKQFPASKVFTVLNLDTVGRLGDSPVTVLGAGSASELVHVFRGTGFVTGIKIKPAMNDYGTSDQTSFIEVGVPGVQFFATAHSDFHRPSDTVNKIDESGLIKVAAVLKEAAEYLSNRLEPLNITLDNAQQKPPGQAGAGSSRKVRIGTIPDFAYQGKGSKLDGVSPGSPAEKAGLKKGDIIIKMNDVAIESLGDMSAVLKKIKAGEKVEIIFLRNKQQMETSAVAEER